MSGPVTGSELHQRVRDWCARTGSTAQALGRAAGVSGGAVSGLGRCRPRPSTTLRLLEAMERYPDGAGDACRTGPKPMHGAGALAEAIARTSVQPVDVPEPATLRERIAREAALAVERRQQALTEGAEPLDLIRRPRPDRATIAFAKAWCGGIAA